jgi:predicted acylesterase/phospholipase RssA
VSTQQFTDGATGASPGHDGGSRRGRVITFYSYKGGTGRSMTLANVAWILAASGKRVLAIDWDIEAPGLQRYFYPFLVDKDLASSDGVMNFVNDYKLKAMTPPPKGQELPPDWYAKYADIRHYAVALKWDFPGEGRLDFVTAGRQDETYPGLVNNFSWQDFYERLGGSQFLDEATRIMRRHYDYVLIDSRTGVSDTSGICTVKMPDTLVVCFTLNYQGINGAATVADYVASQRLEQGGGAAESDGRPAFNIFPVPMRLENAEKRKLERRYDYARKVKFAKYPIYLSHGNRDEYWEKVRVDYDSYYAYEEILAPFGEKQRAISSLLSSAERLTSYLSDRDVQQLSPLPQPKRLEVLAQFEGTSLEEFSAENTDQETRNAFAGMTPEQKAVARAVLLRLVRVAGGGEVEDTRQVVSLKEFDPAQQQTIQKLREFQLLTFRQDGAGGDETVQIAPEVSLQDWTELQGWIEEERGFLLWRQELRLLVDKWQRENKDPGLLPRGAALATARARLLTHARALTPAEAEYIEEGLKLQRREREQQERLAYERRKREDEARETGKDVRHGPRREKSERETHVSPNVIQAQDVLRGQYRPPRELLALARRLQRERQFGYARRVLARARLSPELSSDKELVLRVYQQSALCTYKDADLPADSRLDLALEILGLVEDLTQTKNQETLGLAGAVHKRKWEVDGQKQHLERALFYYLRGYEQGPANDQGYTGINAAYIYDLLAHQDAEEARKASAESATAEERRASARRVREDVVLQVAPLADRPDYEWLLGAWWYYSTVAEALFGLQRYDDAVEWLERGRQAVESIPAWEYETTATQFARLATLQSDLDGAGLDFENTPAWEALRRFFGNEAAPNTAFIGKIGLALSGGGFRASFFHIGVLAKLAELDVLRRVEVLSCVSGGSIIGAHYYLEVRKLLEEKPDRDVTRQDYIDIVRRIEGDFLAGVQRNVRTRVAAEFLTNLKMIFARGYSRTLRAGELYESEIFSRVRDGEGEGPRWLNELFVVPSGEPPDFTPKYHNWGRRAKAPILILNATTLNTGHNWQFTTSWMGEPPAGIDSNIDGNDRLRRMYYTEAPDDYRRVRLGHAVAASACVPGLFDPLILDDLYPERRVLLVDGGACDNQGVGGLLEQDCTVVLVSDGSGQMGSQKVPGGDLLAVPLRTTSILQSRVRAAQYQDLAARRRSQLLRGLMFVHLKEDLDVDPVDWVDCLDPYDASDDARPVYRRGPLTRYGIAKDVQQCLASVRTDLDSFSDVEAYALMTSAYRMTEQAFRAKCVEGFPEPAEAVPWKFLAVEEGMRGKGGSYRYLKRLLGVGSSRAFKVWKLSPLMLNLSALSALAAAALFIYAGLSYSEWRGVVLARQITLGAVVTFVIWVLLGAAYLAVSSALLAALFRRTFGKSALRAVRWRETGVKIAFGVLMATLGWLAARVHLYVFDKLFLRLGSLDHFRRQNDS